MQPFPVGALCYVHGFAQANYMCTQQTCPQRTRRRQPCSLHSKGSGGSLHEFLFSLFEKNMKERPICKGGETNGQNPGALELKGTKQMEHARDAWEVMCRWYPRGRPAVT